MTDEHTERYCLACEKIGHMTNECHSTHGLITPRDRELFRLAGLADAERERAALVCDDEARVRNEAATKHPEFSEERGRCNAAARGAINCAKGIRSGEVVTPNV